MSILNKFKLKKRKNKDENWVAKVLKRRIMMPIYLTIIFVLLFITYAFAMSYLDSKVIFDRNDIIKNKIEQKNMQIKNINNKIVNLKRDINFINGTSITSDGAIKLMTRVCQMLKSKETIGSFYIKKKDNNKYNNVQNFEIQISYGDKDLLMLISKIVLEKVYYLKSIAKTKRGIKFELYKPSTKGKNEK